MKEKKKRKNQKKVFQFIKILFFFAYIFVSLFFLATVKNSLIFSGKYIAIIAGVLILIGGILLLFIIPKKYVLNVFGMILVVLLSGGLIFANYHIGNSIKLINSLFKNNEYDTKYYIAVFEDSEIESVSYIKNGKVAILNRNEDNVKKILNKKYDFSIESYISIADLTTLLENEEVDAIVITDTLFEYVNEETEDRKLKKIDEFTAPGVVDNNTSEFDADKPFLIYLGGLDAWNYFEGVEISDVGLADVNMIAAVNPVTHKVLLVNIPRDYYVQLHGTTGMRDKLTHAGMYGVEMSVATIEDLFDLKLDGYIKVNYGAVIGVVDAVDGVDVVSDTAFTTSHKPNVRIVKGKNHLNGEQALAYAQERYAYYYGDRHRGQNQQDIITAIINKVSTNKKYLMKYDELITSLDPCFATNIDVSVVQSMLKNQLNTLAKWDVESISVDGDGKEEYSYSLPKTKKYVMEPNMDTVNAAKVKIEEVLKEVE